MQTLSVATTVLTNALASALLSSLWQGLLLYGILYLLLKAFPGINVQVKYFLSLGALTVLLLWFADTWVIQYEKLKAVPASYTVPTNSVAYTAETINTAPVQNTLVAHTLPQLADYFPLFILLYAAGLAFMLCRLLISIVQLKRLRKQGILLPDQQLSNLTLQLQKQLSILRPVQLLLSSRINVPMMLGTLKPLILLPVAVINHLTTEQVEAILLHELAHIKRHDYLLNIFQTIAETILFFNPFVWLLSAIARREREHCCDDMVVARSESPLPYIRTLAMLEKERLNSGSLILAATGRKHYLLNRIKRIMEVKKSNDSYTQFAIVFAAIFILALSIAIIPFTPSYAQRSKGEKNTTKNEEQNDEPNNRNNLGDSISTEIDITTKDGTNISGNIYVYPSQKEKVHVQLSLNNRKGLNIKDTGEIRILLDNTIKKTYKNVFDPQLLEEVIAAANSQTLMFRWEKEDFDTNPNHYTQVSTDSNGKQHILYVNKNITVADKTTRKDDRYQMAKDFKQMAQDLGQMAQDLTDAHIEISSVNWDKVKEQLQNNLASLNKEFNDPKHHKGISDEELRESEEAIKDAIKQVDYASRYPIKVIASNTPKNSGSTMADADAHSRAEDARIRGEEARELGNEARERGEEARIRGEEARRLGEEARKRGEEARRQGEEARRRGEELRASSEPIDDMMKKMEEDGLIDRSKSYKIQKKNNALYINGKKQSKAVYNKYSRYLKGQKVTISSEAEGDE